MGFNELKQHGTADFPIELYRLDKNSAKYEMVHHWHRELEAIRVLEGTLSVTVGKNERELCSGDAVLVGCDTLHAAHPKNCRYQCVVWDIGGFIPSQPDCRDFLNGLLSGQRVLLPDAERDAEVLRDIHALFESMEAFEESAGTHFDVISALYRLYGTLYRNKMTKKTDPAQAVDETTARLKKALTLIRSSYHEELTLARMAQACDMSPQYFCSCFRSMTKRSPMEYLNYYRLTTAVKMLVNTDESVTQIAYACGFNDLSYFIKQFKNEKGVSPGKFRKQRTKDRDGSI